MVMSKVQQALKNYGQVLQELMELMLMLLSLYGKLLHKV